MLSGEFPDNDAVHIDCDTATAQSLSHYQHTYLHCSGGGTSGCVIAARLAESFPPNGPSILVIEGGPDSKDLELVSRVGGLFEAMGGDLDWNFETVPQKRLNNRVINLARGKFLGGSR